MKFLTALLVSLASLSALALEVGKLAPDFKLKGIAGKSEDISLSQFKGKYVVLEWKNHGCPFVKKHYGAGNMQALQKKYTGQNVIWLSVVSSAPGKQGHTDEAGAKKEFTEHKSSASNVLLDSAGTVGKLYEAKTTPHMYIIDKEGMLAYQGAIDDKADAEAASIPGAKNYVAQALNEMMAGKKVSVATTKSYGCGVKY